MDRVIFRVLLFMMCVVLGLFSPSEVKAGEIELKTYNPSPRGIYQKIQLIPYDFQVTEFCNNGEMSINSVSGILYYCEDNIWRDNVADLWNYSGTNLFTSSDRFSAVNVGIGVTAPAASLHLRSANDTALLIDSSNSESDAVLALTDGSTGIGTEGLRIAYDSSVGDAYFDTTYNNDAASLHFRTKGSQERMTILGNGNIGVGVTNPFTKLTVYGGSEVAMSVMRSANNVQNSGLVFGTGASTVDYEMYMPANTQDLRWWDGADRVTFKRGGNVGIGVTAPNALLDISGAGNQRILNINGTNNPEIAFANNGAIKLEIGVATGANSYIAGSAANDVVFRQTGGQKILFSTSSMGITNDLTLSGGNVGIGVTSTPNELTIGDSNGDNAASVLLSASGNGGVTHGCLGFTNEIPFTNGWGMCHVNNADAGVDEGLEIQRWRSLDDHFSTLFIKNDGKIGMGTYQPLYELHVNNANGSGTLMVSGDGGVNNYAGIILEDDDRSDTYVNSWAFSFVKSADARVNKGFSISRWHDGYAQENWFFIRADNGNTGIGTILPSQKLEVAGNIQATGWLSPSDERLKTNISSIPNSLEKVSKINGVYFNWKNPDEFGQGQQVGVIAQEVEKIMPEVVFTNDKGMKTVDYPKLVPLLIEAIKGLSLQNAEIQKANQSMQEKIKELEESINKLK